MTSNAPPDAPLAPDDNQLIAERREKLQAIRAAGIAFPNDFKPSHQAGDLHRRFWQVTNEELEPQNVNVAVAGRMMLKRVMGKACFATLQDGSGRIQLYVTLDGVGADTLEAFKRWDLGDIVACVGALFRTRAGELSVRASQVRLLTKSLRPLPDKFHGMVDQEQKYRQRYVDLITDDAARSRFVARSKAVASIRNFMIEHAFQGAGGLVDIAFDRVGRHVGGFGLFDRKAQTRIGAQIAASSAGRDHDFANHPGPDFSSLFILAPLAVLDIRPFAVSGHKESLKMPLR